MTEPRKFTFSFFNKQNETHAEAHIVDWLLEEIAPGFRAIAQHRPSSSLYKAALNDSKAGGCFIAGLAPTRSPGLTRSCISLDGDSLEDSLALYKATEGYARIIWNTYKDGLSVPPEDSDLPCTYDDSCMRIRILLPLDRDMTVSEWGHGAGVVARFPGTDPLNVAFNNVSYNPVGRTAVPEIIFNPGKLFPAGLIVSNEAVTKVTKLADYQDTATEVATTEHLSRLRKRLLKRAERSPPVGREHSLEEARWIYALTQGASIDVHGKRTRKCFLLGNLLARELNTCSVESILVLCGPSVLAMQAEGSKQKIEMWRKTMLDFRGIMAASEAEIDFDFEVDKSGGEQNQLGEHTEPMAVLNAAFALLPVPGSDHQVFQVFDGDVCELENSLDKLNTHVADYGKLFGKDNEKREWTSKAIRETVSLWKAIGRKLPSAPVASRFKSDPGFCFKRLSFDPTQGETPAWDEFCDRLSNADYFKAFVWTAFEPKNVGRQILWMVGNGQDGKSTVMGCIANALGAAAAAVDASDFTSTFGTSRLDGKRLVYIGDCKNPLLLTEANVRKVTSGDSIKVEFKGKTGYDKALRLKLMVMSNIQPDITSARADESRLLPITVSESANKNDGKWHDRLAAELPAFLWECRETYTRICPDHGDFALDEATRALVRKCSGLFEDDFAYIAGLKLRFTGNRKDKVSRPEFNNMMRDGSNAYRWTNKQCKDFWAYVQTKHNVETFFVEGNVFIAGCHMHNVPAQNPLTLVDNAPAIGEGAV